MKKRSYRTRTRTDYDCHHLLWRRRDWSRGYAKALRNHWYCMIKIPRDTLHRLIHDEVLKIPVPSGLICRDTLAQLQLLEKANVIHDTDPIEKRLRVLICCLDTGDSPTAEALKRQLEVVENYEKPG